MDIEKLNKSQIVLLTLMTSFMTSIATGIVTVSLMDQAPPAITETVNRVVERTVERVIPGQAAAVASVDPIVKTIVIDQSQQISKGIEIISPSVVRIYSSESGKPVFLGLGVVIDGNGTIVTDLGVLGDSPNTTIELPGSMQVRGFVKAREESTGIAYISAATSSQDGSPIVWKPAKISLAHPVLGEIIIVISGKSANRIGQGLISAMSPMSDGIKDSTLEIETDIPKDGILSGSPIIDTDGSVLGLSTKASRASSESGFISASAFMSGTIVKAKDK